MYNFYCIVFFISLFQFSKSAVPHFPASSEWYRDVSSATLDAESSQIVHWLNSSGGFGYGKFQIDFGFHILHADSNTPKVPVVRNPKYYLPDCDNIQNFPLPSGMRFTAKFRNSISILNFNNLLCLLSSLNNLNFNEFLKAKF
jgi:hypothetical protein